MVCMNSLLTVSALAILVFAIWPDMVGANASKWIIGIAAVVIIIVAWTGVVCKPCMNRKKDIKK